MYPEQVALWRDWTIVILACFVMISALTLGFSILLIVRRIGAIIYLIGPIVDNIKGTFSLVSGTIGRPKGRSYGFMSEMGRIIGIIMRLSKRRKRKARSE